MTAHVRHRLSLAALDRGNALLADALRDPAPVLPHARPVHRMADPARLAAALAAWQQQLAAADAAVANARALADPRVPVVTVGQQPGLLTGPLYTFYKACTAITLARRLRAIPVFWVATDDDDRAEIDHCACRDRHGDTRVIRYPDDAGYPGQLVGDLPLAEAGPQVLAQLAVALDGLPHADAALALATETLAEAADLGTWCCRLLARVLSPHGLVVCDPRLPAVRALSAEVMRRELADPLRTTAAVNARAAALRAAGYHAALTKPDELCNLFFVEGQRRRIAYRDGRFHVGERVYTQADLFALLEADPARFVPNAVLRPVAQEYLFGSAAFVAGPHELGYWAQLGPVFAALEVPMPPVVPRAGASLLTRHEATTLAALDIPPLALRDDFDRVRYAQLAAQCPPAVAAQFEAGRATIEALVHDLAAAAATVDPTLAASAQATRQHMLHELERLERKTLKALERRSEEITHKLERLRDALFPAHGLQERSLTLLWAIARFGPTFPDEVLHLLDGEEGQHLLLEMNLP